MTCSVLKQGMMIELEITKQEQRRLIMTKKSYSDLQTDPEGGHDVFGIIIIPPQQCVRGRVGRNQVAEDWMQGKARSRQGKRLRPIAIMNNNFGL